MAIEIVVVATGLFAAAITTFLAFQDAESPNRRRLILAAALFAAIGGLAAFELDSRQSGRAAMLERLSERWTLAQDAYVERIEIEILLPDGMSPARELSASLAGMQFEITFPTRSGEMITWSYDLESIFQASNLPNAAMIGVPAATVSVRRFGKAKEAGQIKSMACVASDYTTSIVTHDSKPEDFTICSIKHVVHLDERIRFSNLASSSSIKLVNKGKNVEGTHCFGPCSATALSIRAVLNTGDGLLPDTIDIAPIAYLDRPTLTTDEQQEFELSGQALDQLAEMRFKHSLGFRDRAFEATLGVVNHLYKLLTVGAFSARVGQVVWTTDKTPNFDSIINAAPYEAHTNPEVTKISEWCGFGKDGPCWHVFAVFYDVKVSTK